MTCWEEEFVVEEAVPNVEMAQHSSELAQREQSEWYLSFAK